jgi:hydrogenase nickel incorporation protein HypA/HybF
VHELAIVDALIAQVRQEVQRAGAVGSVTRVELVVGRFSGVCPDSLRFAFEMLAPGTIVEGAELALSQPPAIARCRTCGAETQLDDLAGTCPQCQSPEVSLEGSRDLVLQSIELEDHQDQTHEDRRGQEDPQSQ